MKRQFIGALGMVSCVLCHAQGTDGTWNAAASGLWTDQENWKDGVIADGVGATASFVVNFPNTTELIVTPDVPKRTIGHMVLSNLNENVTGSLTAGSASSTQHLVFDTGGADEFSRIETGPAALFKMGAFATSNRVMKTGPGSLTLAHANNTALARSTNQLYVVGGRLTIGNSYGITGMYVELGGGDADVVLAGSNATAGNLGNAQTTGITSGTRITVSSNGTGRVTYTSSSEMVSWNPWELNRTLVVDGGKRMGFGGTVTGDGGFYITGNSRLDLRSNANNFKGGITISSGSLMGYEYNNSIPSGCRVTFGDEHTGDAGVTLMLSKYETLGANRFLHFTDTGSSGLAQITMVSWNSDRATTIAAPIQADRNIAIRNTHTGSYNLTVSGLISGNGGVTYQSTHTRPNYVVLSATNTYAGVTSISNGYVIVQNLGRLGMGKVVIGGDTEGDSKLFYKPTTLANAALMDAIDDSAALHMNNGAVIDFSNLEPFGEPARVVEVVRTLAVDGEPMFSGTYGATGSGASTIRDDLFTGAQGMLRVLEGPPRGTTVILK